MSEHHAIERGTAILAALVGLMLSAPTRVGAAQFPTLDQSYQRAQQWLKNAQSERRTRIDEEKKDWRRDRDAVERRLARARETVLQNFEVYDRDILSTSPVVREKFRKAKEHRETMLHRFVEYAGDAKGSIANGDAQNFFLELCGSSAFAGNFDRSTKAANTQKDPNQNFLSKVTAEYRLQGYVLHRIVYRRGLTGPRLTGRLNQDPLDVEFPQVLSTPFFQPLTSEIKRCREAVLRELRTGKAVSADVADALLKSVNDLTTAVKEKKSALMHDVRFNGQNNAAQSEWIRLNRAQGPLLALLQGAYRLIEAKSIDDVALPKLDETNGVTIEELMAYMHTNNLYFSPADPNGEAAYHTVFDMMTRYYIDLVVLKNCESGVKAMDEEDRRMQQLLTLFQGMRPLADLTRRSRVFLEAQ